MQSSRCEFHLFSLQEKSETDKMTGIGRSLLFTTSPTRTSTSMHSSLTCLRSTKRASGCRRSTPHPSPARRSASRPRAVSGREPWSTGTMRPTVASRSSISTSISTSRSLRLRTPLLRSHHVQPSRRSFLRLALTGVPPIGRWCRDPTMLALAIPTTRTAHSETSVLRGPPPPCLTLRHQAWCRTLTATRLPGSRRPPTLLQLHARATRVLSRRSEARTTRPFRRSPPRQNCLGRSRACLSMAVRNGMNRHHRLEFVVAFDMRISCSDYRPPGTRNDREHERFDRLLRQAVC
jgi:hypothetical protein